jgi:preprotein translocase subunit SecE
MQQVVNFLGEVRAELSKVSWPTPRQTINLTLVVIIVSIIVGLYVGGIDLLLAKLSGTYLR